MEKLKHKRLIISCLLAAIVLITGMTAGCQGNAGEKTTKRPKVTDVTVSPVSLSVVDDIYETTGTVKSNTVSMVAGRVMGVVTSILVKEGDTVKAGQLLLVIDNRDAAQRVRAAGMAVASANQNKDLAEKTWQRYKNLYDLKAISRQEMDQVETQKKVSEAEYERIKAMENEARTYLSFTRVTAPINGRITEKRIDVGSMANPGVPLLVLESSGKSNIEVSLDAGLRPKVKTGMAVEAAVESIEQPLRGKIREIFPSIDPLSRTFTIKVEIDHAGIRSGLFARVYIPIGKRETIVVPQQAIVQKGQLIGVFAVDTRGIVTYRLVRKGKTFPHGVEVLSGLTAGDRIITSGIAHAIDGGAIGGENIK